MTAETNPRTDAVAESYDEYKSIVEGPKKNLIKSGLQSLFDGLSRREYRKKQRQNERQIDKKQSQLQPSNPEQKDPVEGFTLKIIEPLHTVKLIEGVSFKARLTKAPSVSEEKIILNLTFTHNKLVQQQSKQLSEKSEKSKQLRKAEKKKELDIVYETGEPVTIVIDDEIEDIIVKVSNIRYESGVSSSITPAAYVVVECISTEKGQKTSKKIQLKLEVLNGYYVITEMIPVVPKDNQKAIEQNSDASYQSIDESEEFIENELVKLNEKKKDKRSGVSFKIEEVFEDSTIGGKAEPSRKMHQNGQPYFRFNFFQINDKYSSLDFPCGYIRAAFGSNPQVFIFQDGETRVYVSSNWKENIGFKGAKKMNIEIVHSLNWNNGMPDKGEGYFQESYSFNPPVSEKKVHSSSPVKSN